MKKLLSLIMCSAVVCSALALTATAANRQDGLGFAVASDLHVNLPEEELVKTNEDPLFWYANRRASMDNESGFILDSFLSQCASDDRVDFVLISGDLADNGRKIPGEHALVAEKLRAFEQTSGKEVYVICGNHDLGNNCVTGKDEFKSIYSDFGYDHALAERDSDCSYTADLGDKYRLIALDSTDYDKSTEDGITADKLIWVRQQTFLAERDGRYPILMMHHNLLEHMPLQPVISGAFIVKNHIAVAESFANQGIRLVLTGHEHCSDAASYTSALGNTITDFATTALSMYPLCYRVFSVTENNISYSSEQIKSIDTAAIAKCVAGYSPEMLAAMNDDPNAFAKGYLKNGVKYRITLSFSAEKLGIEQGSIYYDLVMSLVNRLTDILEMPLYGDGSVQELAAQYNIVLPDSAYKNGWDIATELVASHYEGSESHTLESPEITLLLRSVALIMREELSIVNSRLCLGAADAVFEHLGVSRSTDKLGKSVFGSDITPGEYLLVAVASPLIYGFAYDGDGVDDNNGIIQGYGAEACKIDAENIAEKITNFFKKILLYIRFFFKYAVNMTNF